MLMAAARSGLSSLRQPARAARLATFLWIAWAVIVWNMVLDQAIALAGRRYVIAAVGAAQGPGPYARVDEWMRPATTHGFWAASAAAAAILVVGLLSIRVASRLSGRTRSTGI